MQFESRYTKIVQAFSNWGVALLSTYNKYYSTRWKWLFLGSNKWGKLCIALGKYVSVENVVGVFLTQNDPNLPSHSALKIFKMCHNKFQCNLSINSGKLRFFTKKIFQNSKVISLFFLFKRALCAPPRLVRLSVTFLT